MKILLGTIFLLGMASPAYSQIFKVQTTACGVNAEICEGLRQQLQNSVNEHAPSVEIGKYASGMAKANKISSKGGTTDYANKFDAIMLSASVNAGVEADISDTDNLENTASGVALSPAVMVGMNLGLLPVGKIGGIKTRDLDLFLSFMSYNKEKIIDQDEIKLGGQLKNFGAQIRYNWIKEKDILPFYMLQWTGVQLHTGYQFSRNKLNVNYLLGPDTIDPVEYNGQSANVKEGSATALINHSTHSIPLEISTGLRFLYLFTLYGGLGTDLTLSSSSKAQVNASGDVETTLAGTAFSIDGQQSANGKADFFNSRAFAGIQFNIPLVRIFVQGHHYFGNDSYGVNAGLKLLY